MVGGMFATCSLVCTLALTACSGSTITQPQDVMFPNSNVSFIGQVLTFLVVTCANAGCHNDMAAAAGIRLTSYSAVLFGRPNLCVPSEPDESLMIQVLDGTMKHDFGDLQQRVSPAQIKGLRQWVIEGALNN